MPATPAAECGSRHDIRISIIGIPSNSDILNRCLAVLSGPLSPVVAPDSGTQESSGLHLRAACFAARWVPDSTLWSQAVVDTDLVAELVRVSPAEFGDWRALLRPVLSHMVEPLEVILANPDSSAQSRLFAFDLLAELAKRDVQRLFSLLQRADESQFPIVLQTLRRTPEGAAELPVRFLEEANLNRSDPRQDEEKARSIARVAALLVHLKHDQIVWKFLSRSENPTVRSLLIEQFPKLRVSPLLLWQRFRDEADDGIRFALLLCLGGYLPEQIPSELKQDVAVHLHSLMPVEHDPGVHSAIRWLLRTWCVEVASTEASTGLEEMSRSETLSTTSATGSSDRRWFVNREGQHFAVVDAVSFQMGSAESLTSRDPDEVLHVREINRRYAIAMYEVTAQQFQKFHDHREAVERVDDRQLAAREVAAGHALFTEEEPVGGISWYDAAAYCNWLSEQDGLPADQWCYEPNAKNQFASGMSVKSGFLSLAGYRLPTEAEWEFACRAGTNTSRYYGDSESILSQYAWHSPMADDRAHAVGLLRPNDFGLFDVLGNRYEWCHEVFRAYLDHPTARKIESGSAVSSLIVLDEHVGETVQDVDRRVIRGGSFDFSARHARSAYRTNDLAADRIRNNGLRPSRTLTGSLSPK